LKNPTKFIGPFEAALKEAVGSLEGSDKYPELKDADTHFFVGFEGKTFKRILQHNNNYYKW
jgi:hypothetical protein